MIRTTAAPLALVLMVAQTVSGQSIGELAKKTAADREKAKTVAEKDGKPADAKKVYTDEDIKKLGGSAAPTTAPAVDTAKPDAESPAKPATLASPDTAKDEAWWKARAKTLDQQHDTDMTLLDAAVRHMNSLASELRPSTISVLATARDLHAAEAEVRRLTATVENDKRLRADLEEEARRANVPPGWLRWRQ